MRKTIFILLLLLIPFVFGANFTLDNLQATNKNTSSAISPQCRDEFDSFMYLQPEELVNKYCDVVQFRIFWLVVLVGVMWIFEPAFKKIIKKNVKDNPGLWIYLYKYLGVGLLIIIGYALVLLR